VHNLSYGEGISTERRTTDDRHPEQYLKPPDLRVEDLEKLGGASALDDSPILLGSPGDLDRLRLVCTVSNADARELEPSSVDAYERVGALPVVGAAPALAEGTAGVEPAGEAERAMAAKSEALAPWTQGETRHEIETPSRGEGERAEALPQGERMLEAPPQKGSRKPEALLPEGERELDASSRGGPNNGKRRSGREALPQCKRDPPPRRDPNEDVLATWYPGGESPRKQIFDSKRPIEAKSDAVGIDARNKNKDTWPYQNQSEAANYAPVTLLLPIHHCSILSSRSRFFFVLRSIERARRRPERCRGTGNTTRATRLVAVTPSSRASLRLCP